MNQKWQFAGLIVALLTGLVGLMTALVTFGAIDLKNGDGDITVVVPTQKNGPIKASLEGDWFYDFCDEESCWENTLDLTYGGLEDGPEGAVIYDYEDSNSDDELVGGGTLYIYPDGYVQMEGFDEDGDYVITMELEDSNYMVSEDGRYELYR